MDESRLERLTSLLGLMVIGAVQLVFMPICNSQIGAWNSSTTTPSLGL